MALFKVNRGSSSNLPIKMTDGWAYFCTDTAEFFIDYADNNGELHRKQINADEAKKIAGYDIATILNSSDIEIPTSKAVLDAINNVDKKASVQADLSVNDISDPAYVKNRTHWVETEYVTFIDNETVEFFETGEGFVAGYADEDIVFINGNTYTFVIDGTPYDCVACIYEEYGYTYIGNLSLLDSSFEDTLEPFYVFCYNDSEISTMGLARAGLMIGTTLEGNSHIISLSGLDIVYHKIDKNYLPYLAGQKGSAECAEIFNDYSGNNVASGGYAHAEGSNTTASGWYAHAEGNNTTASSTNAHAEGSGTTAEGVDSHAEGSGTTASGYICHAEGYNSIASGDYGAHAEGTSTVAAGNYSHSEGWYTTANSESQHVQGEWNVVDSAGAKNVRGTYAHIVGNGTSDAKRSNAHTLAWDGTAWFAKTVKVGGTSQDNAQELVTQSYVDALIETLRPKSTTVSLPAASWTGNTHPYSQVVTINGVTENSKIDLQPTAAQIVSLNNEGIAMIAENNNGVVTIYAIGNKPSTNYTIQVLLTEVTPV